MDISNRPIGTAIGERVWVAHEWSEGIIIDIDFYSDGYLNWEVELFSDGTVVSVTYHQLTFLH